MASHFHHCSLSKCGLWFMEAPTTMWVNYFIILTSFVWLISFCKQVNICLTSDLLMSIPCHRMSLLLCKIHNDLLVIQKQLCVVFFGDLLMLYQFLGRMDNSSFKLPRIRHLVLSWHLQVLLHATVYTLVLCFGYRPLVIHPYFTNLLLFFLILSSFIEM